MGDNMFKVCVSVEYKEDGRYEFQIYSDSSLGVNEIRSILVGGVSLSIHGEKTNKEQSKALQEVIDFLVSDFVDVESFDDVEFKDPPTKDDDTK